LTEAPALSQGSSSSHSPRDSDRVPVPDPTALTNELVTRAVKSLRELIETRLDANDKRFEERFDLLDRATVKAAVDVKDAVDAAFSAQGSAAMKQELAFTKQIDQLGIVVASIVKASDNKLDDFRKTFDDKFNDLKDRLVAIESRTAVVNPTTEARLNMLSSGVATLMTSSDQRTGSTTQSAINVNLLIAIAGVIVAIVTAWIISRPTH
jgi:hypothetical protein